MNVTRIVRSAAPIALAVGLLVVIFTYVDFGDVVRHLSATRLEFFLPAVGLMLLTIGLATLRYRWTLEMHQGGGDVGFWRLFQLNLLTLFAAHFLPIGALADAMRALMSKRLTKLPTSQAVESVVADRVLAAAGLAATGLLFLPLQAALEFPLTAILVQAVAFTALLVIVAIGGVVSVRFPEILGPLAPIGGRFVGLLSSPVQALRQGAIALGTALLVAGMLSLLAAGLGIDLPIQVTLAVTSAVYLSQVIPVFYAGFGSRELVLATLLVPPGILQDSQAIALALSVGLCNLAASLPGAAFAWPLLKAARTGTAAGKEN